MVLIDNIEKWKNNVVRSFKARITILQHSTTIKTGYSPVLHCGPIRQSARLVIDEDKPIRSGDSCYVTFTFQFHSEFLEKGMIFFFRDGHTKGVGEIVSLE